MEVQVLQKKELTPAQKQQRAMERYQKKQQQKVIKDSFKVALKKKYKRKVLDEHGLPCTEIITGADAFAEKILSIIQDDNVDPETRLKYASFIADRVDGKPTEEKTINASVTANPFETFVTRLAEDDSEDYS